jgi:hypothetical protein
VPFYTSLAKQNELSQKNKYAGPPTRYHADRAIRRYRSSSSTGGSAVYRDHRLEERRQYSGLHHQSIQHSKGGPRICKYEPAQYRRPPRSSYFDDRRLLGDGAGLSSCRNLHTYDYSPISRNRLHELQHFWSRAVDGKFGQLVTLETRSRTGESKEPLRAQKNNCKVRPACLPEPVGARSDRSLRMVPRPGTGSRSSFRQPLLSECKNVSVSRRFNAHEATMASPLIPNDQWIKWTI